MPPELPKRKSETKTVAYLFPEEPAATNINHFSHRYDDDYQYAPASAAAGLVTIPAFATSGGAGIRPSINGVPPLYVLPDGRDPLPNHRALDRHARLPATRRRSGRPAGLAWTDDRRQAGGREPGRLPRKPDLSGAAGPALPRSGARAAAAERATDATSSCGACCSRWAVPVRRTPRLVRSVRRLSHPRKAGASAGSSARGESPVARVRDAVSNRYASRSRNRRHLPPGVVRQLADLEDHGVVAGDALALSLHRHADRHEGKGLRVGRRHPRRAGGAAG